MSQDGAQLLNLYSYAIQMNTTIHRVEHARLVSNTTVAQILNLLRAILART